MFFFSFGVMQLRVLLLFLAHKKIQNCPPKGDRIIRQKICGSLSLVMTSIMVKGINMNCTLIILTPCITILYKYFRKKQKHHFDLCMFCLLYFNPQGPQNSAYYTTSGDIKNLQYMHFSNQIEKSFVKNDLKFFGSCICNMHEKVFIV